MILDLNLRKWEQDITEKSNEYIAKAEQAAREGNHVATANYSAVATALTEISTIFILNLRPTGT